ncbi:MAG: S-layer homology domain-containing protein [Patescibacteria group bacterium]
MKYRIIPAALIVACLFFTVVLFAHASFSDTQGNKYQAAIEFIQSRNIVSGYPDGTFRPNNMINRAELLTIIVGQKYKNLQSKNCFNDVSASAWYSKFVCKGLELGIVAGYPDGSFKPDRNISFVEALIILQHAHNISVNTSGSQWFKDSVDKASSANLIPLDVTDFNQTLTRGQMAEMMTRILKYEENTPEQVETSCNTPSCLEKRTATLFDTPSGMVTKSAMGLGETWEFEPNRFIRVESVDEPWSKISIWTSDPKGCRLFTTREVGTENDLINYKIGFVFGNDVIVPFRLNKKIYIDVTSGSNAYNECKQYSFQPEISCLSLPGSGRYTISDGHFRYVFPDKKYTPGESLRLDFDNLQYNHLLTLFPALSLAYSPTGIWQVSEYRSGELAPQFDKSTEPSGLMIDGLILKQQDLPWLDLYSSDVVNSTITGVATNTDPSTGLSWYANARMALANTNNGLITDTYQYLQLFLNEIHEFGHAAFYGTQGSGAGEYKNLEKYRTMLDEGRANYIESKGGLPQSDYENYMGNCRDTSYGANSPISYKDEKADQYTVGSCFYYLVEKACGTAAINSAFAKVLEQPYHPNDIYPEYFKIFENYCPDKTQYQKIMNNFGISNEVLNEQGTLKRDLLPGNACSM